MSINFVDQISSINYFATPPTSILTDTTESITTLYTELVKEMLYRHAGWQMRVQVQAV